MKKITLLLLLATGVMLLISGAGTLAAQTDGCVTASCHATMGKDQYVHSPVADGMCTICHQAENDPLLKSKHPNNLKITLVQQGSDLCTMCHDSKNSKKTVHSPIKDGDCTFCHSPHQSSELRLLKEKLPELCLQCHSETLVKNASVHDPVAAGKCTLCHDVHQSDLQKLLRKEGNDLCLSCHAKMDALLKSSKTVHPAIEIGCLMCHSPHSSSNNRMLTASMPGLCEQCHEPKNTKKTVHAPIQGGDCTSCHNPHASPMKGMMIAEVPQLCFQCHSDDIVKQKILHPPVEAGDCSGCHDNHQSDFPFRLVAEGNALCFQCHPDKEEGLKTKKGHYPVQQSCVQCHSPHGTPFSAMLRDPVPELCANCHPKEAMARKISRVTHGPMLDQKTCKNCHDPHFSDQPRLLLAVQQELCLSCHDKEVETPSGKIENMKELLAKNKNGHGPVREGDCVACHNPHGSDFWRILVKNYPQTFYASFSEETYDLCFSCHDKAAFTERKTDTTTGFRNGNRNLHFLHVDKQRKGRTCRACHEVHADNNQYKHVREKAHFSGWTMPLNFTPWKDGGTCAPGCHGEKRYTR